MKLLLRTSGAIAALALAGCGSTTVIRTVTDKQATSSPSSTTAKPRAAEPAQRPGKLRVGDAVTVRTSDTTLQLKVTSVLDPLPVSEYDEADSGNRFVGIGLSVRNAGTAPYSDALDNGSTLILSGATQGSTTIVSGGPCGNGFGSDVKIAPGDHRNGCIAFEVPARKRLRSFQFTGDSGFADETGQWELPSTPVRAVHAAAPSSSAPAAASVAPANTSWRACDPNISVASATTCPFAENVFYEYYGSGESASISAFSPAAGSFIATSCSAGDPVVCKARDGGAVRFSQAALDMYSPAQAARYAATHVTGDQR